jgi:hypothetical protein
MDNTTKLGFCQELKSLLEQWKDLETMPAATERDFARLKARIDEICKILDSFRDDVR